MTGGGHGGSENSIPDPTSGRARVEVSGDSAEEVPILASCSRPPTRELRKLVPLSVIMAWIVGARREHRRREKREIIERFDRRGKDVAVSSAKKLAFSGFRVSDRYPVWIVRGCQ